MAHPYSSRTSSGTRRRRPRRRRRRDWRPTALIVLALGLAGTVLTREQRPPSDIRDLCVIFAEKPSWHRSTRSAFAKWGVPEAVQLAILYQESHFRARARPPRRKILWIVPWRRPSSAYGYAQVLDATWEDFRSSTGRAGARRHRFDDVAHFVAWYGEVIHRTTGIAKSDAYNLYLAYHEGPGGYRRGSHLDKEWLLGVARKVAARARAYQRQYDACADDLKRPWRLWLGLGLVLVLLAWQLRRRRRRRRAV